MASEQQSWQGGSGREGGVRTVKWEGWAPRVMVVRFL